LSSQYILPCLLYIACLSTNLVLLHANLVTIITSFYPEEVWVVVDNEAKPPSNVYMLRTTKNLVCPTSIDSIVYTTRYKVCWFHSGGSTVRDSRGLDGFDLKVQSYEAKNKAFQVLYEIIEHPQSLLVPVERA